MTNARDDSVKAKYRAYVESAATNVAQFVRNLLVSPVSKEADGVCTALELPHIDGARTLRLAVSHSDAPDDDEALMLRVIESHYRDTFSVAMQFSDAAQVNSFYRDAAQVELAQFLDAFGASIWGRRPAPGVILEMLALLERLSSITYEGRPASMTVMLRHSKERPRASVYLGRDLVASKKTARLFSGAEHTICANLDGMIVAVEAPRARRYIRREPAYPVPTNYQWLAMFAHQRRAMTFALAPNGDISIIAARRTVAMRQHGVWRLVGTKSFVRKLTSLLVPIARMSPSAAADAANYLTMLALSLNHRREGALIIVVPSSIPAKLRPKANASPIELAYQHLLTPSPLASMPVSLLLAALALDGATFISGDRMVLGFGQILASDHADSGAGEGARSRAAVSASKHGVALKVSTDGPISLYADGSIVGELLSQHHVQIESAKLDLVL